MTTVEKVKAGELAIFNDSNDAIHKIIKYFKPTVGWLPEYQNGKFFIYDCGKECGFDFKDGTTLPTIPATELLKLLESETKPNEANELKNKIQLLEQELHVLKGKEKMLESETAWSPKVGEMVEVSSKEVWRSGVYFGKGTDEFPYLASFPSGHVFSWKLCRPLPTKQLTRTEAEALLSELKGETYKIVD